MAEPQGKKQKGFFKKIRLKYRLKVLDESNYEEKISWRLSPLNVFVLFGSIIIVMVITTIYLVAFTSLREFIPGYADNSTKEKMYELLQVTDSLEKVVAAQDIYLYNLSMVLQGKTPVDSFQTLRDTTINYDNIRNQKSDADSALRELVNAEDSYNINPVSQKKSDNPISNFLFYSPIRGEVIEAFKPEDKHYGIDVVAQKNEAVKSVLSGTVVFTGWTAETGYIIAIQHTDNLISIYKHNSSLLKKDGNAVHSGEPIAIVGNSGELTTGPHLHFELWYNGRAINPEDVIVF